MNFLNNKTFVFITIIVGISISPLVHATYPDIVGTWTGSASGNDFTCTNPADEGPFTDQLTVVFSNQSGGSFNVSVTSVEDDGEVAVDTGTGTFTSASTLSFTVTFTDGGSSDSTTLNGTINGSTISLSFSGSNTGGDDCDWSGNGAISRSNTVVATDVTASSTVTDAVLFNTLIQGTVSGVSSHISGALSGIRFSGGPRVTDNQFTMEGSTGLNAGDGTAIPYGMWGSYSYTDYENDLSSTAFDGSNHSFLGGVDFGFWDNTIIGIAFGYDKGDIDTTFNGGNQDTDSYTIAPYFGALLTDSMSVDFSVGYSNVKYDQFRVTTGTTTQITSSPIADRWFSAFNLNGVSYYDKWILGARVGALYASSVTESFTESNGTVVGENRTKVGSVSIAGDAAYSWKDFEPFVNLAYNYDFSLREISVTTGPQPSNDTDDILMTTGVRYFHKNGITGNLEYSKRFLRDNFDEDRVSLTIRADF